MTQNRTATLTAARPGIRRIEIDPDRSESPTFEGRSFGSVGQYEKLRGTAYGELDPTDPRNAVITDLDLAPVNERGMVEYSTDIFILKPINLDLGNRRVILDFNNRGGMRVGLLNGARAINNPTTAADAGTGFVFDMGYAVVGNGWDISASGHDAMTINVPVATNNGETITGPSYEYIVFDNETTLVSDLAYAAATLDQSQARLTVKEHLDDTPVEIPVSEWEYTSDEGSRHPPAARGNALQAEPHLRVHLHGQGPAGSRNWPGRHPRLPVLPAPRPRVGGQPPGRPR